jgi:ribonuclease P protein component
MERLKQRSDFVAAAAGARVHGAGFVLQARERGDDGAPRIGFTVSKKVGNAVERNRVRRRLREVVRQAAQDRIPAGRDYVLVGRRAALDLSFERLVADFTGALRKVVRQPRTQAPS